MLNLITFFLFMNASEPMSIWEGMKTAKEKPSSISSRYLVLSAESERRLDDQNAVRPETSA